MTKARWGRLLGYIIGVNLIGSSGSLATFSQLTTWYGPLIKPSFNPPNWIFGPVWTTLFTLMGISLYLVWLLRGQKEIYRQALTVFGIQLVLNVVWSFLFFGLHQPGWALGEIMVLVVAIALTIVAFRKISQAAAWLLVPYFVWVLFATILNAAVWLLN